MVFAMKCVGYANELRSKASEERNLWLQPTGGGLDVQPIQPHPHPTRPIHTLKATPMSLNYCTKILLWNPNGYFAAG